VSKKPETVVVPADLLTRACLLLGELPAKHVADVYVQLLACKPARTRSTARDRSGT
jgi:hypothetical protein